MTAPCVVVTSIPYSYSKDESPKHRQGRLSSLQPGGFRCWSRVSGRGGKTFDGVLLLAIRPQREKNCNRSSSSSSRSHGRAVRVSGIISSSLLLYIVYEGLRAGLSFLLLLLVLQQPFLSRCLVLLSHLSPDDVVVQTSQLRAARPSICLLLLLHRRLPSFLPPCPGLASVVAVVLRITYILTT